MKYKEVFFAITIGFVLGLIITFGVWRANKSLKQLPQLMAGSTPTPTTIDGSSTTPSTSPATQQPSPTPAPDEIILNLTAPQDEALTDRSSIELTGKTVANATVSIVFETGQMLTTASASGDFSADITLEGGYNLITVSAFDNTGKSATKTLTVTYTTAKI